MFNINLEVIDVTESEEPKKTGKGKNKVLSVTYKTDEGKVEAKKLYDWATKTEIWEAFKGATKGNVFSIDKEKNEKGFWEWVSLHRQDAPLKVQEKGNPVPTKPSYETPDERAHRQVMIVRQSSISSAVNMLGPMSPKGDFTAYAACVIETAKRFESYVMGNTIQDLINDMPE